MNTCACGCGEPTMTTYVRGHNHRKPLIERFWKYIGIVSLGGCLVWSGLRNDKGYGLIQDRSRGKLLKAHRVAWELANGPIPAGLMVLHRCDHPWCVDVAHLFLGTAADNSADMVAKGRQARGAKLSAARFRRLAA